LTTTTKIFVILVCLFAFIFTPMAIQFAARTENWRQDAESSRNAARVAQAHESSMKSILEAREADWQRQFAEGQRRFQDAQQQLAQSQRSIAELTQQRDQLARSREMLETQAGILTAEVSVKSKHNDELGDAREKALGRERQMSTANAWLNDQLQLRRSEVDVLKQQLDQARQQMLSCRAENEDLRRGAGMSKAGEPLTAVPGGTVEPLNAPRRSKITGRVKQVQGSSVSIDVGSASGIRPGMKMIISRDGQYIGDIRITSAQPSEAVGTVSLTNQSGRSITSGDLVIDEAGWNAG
jgi:hypothetical protein